MFSRPKSKKILSNICFPEQIYYREYILQKTVFMCLSYKAHKLPSQFSEDTKQLTRNQACLQ